MHARIPLIGIAAIASALAACSQRDDSDLGFERISRIDATHIAVHARNAPDAIVASDGTLTIDGKPIALTPTQNEHLRAYFGAAEALRKDAFATGMAGLATAGTAITSVVKGLASGEPDKIDRDVNAQAAKVEVAATKICADLGELQVHQDAIAADLAVFRPYATLTAQDARKCDRGR
jgi:hypothetical protein